MEWFRSALRDRLDGGRSDFEAVIEGALVDTGGLGVTVITPSAAPTPSPIHHFCHCQDKWDKVATKDSQLMAAMTQAMPGASEDTKESLKEVWEQLTRYPEAELIGALEYAGEEAMEEDEGEDDENKLDDVPLALRAAAPVGLVASLRCPCTSTVVTQTGGMKEAGRTVTTNKGATIDAGTLVRWLKVTMLLLKATHVDQGRTNLLLNYLISATVKQGRMLHVPQGTNVQEVPLSLYA